MDILGWIIVLAGMLFIVGAFIPAIRKGIGIKNPMVAVLVGALVIGGGWYFGFVDFETTEAPSGTTVSTYPSFTIEPDATKAANDNTTLNDAETTFTTPFCANTTSGTGIHASDPITGYEAAFVQPRYEFQITPVVPTGRTVTADDLCTIYFEVTNPETEVSSGSSDYELIREVNSIRYANFTTDDGTNTHDYHVDGSITMLYTDTIWVNLTIDPYHTAAANIDEYTSHPVYVKFYNVDNSWSESYTVNFLCTGTR